LAGLRLLPSEGRTGFWIFNGVALAGALVVFFADPATTSFYPQCPFFLLTGWYCPGCGTLRALHQLSHGHLLTALDLNALAMLALPLCAYAWLSQVRELYGRPPLPTLPFGRTAVLSVVATIVLYGVARNLPIYPLSVLAP
jgi:hypothetical protein